jgi:hypothetical protein
LLDIIQLLILSLLLLKEFLDFVIKICEGIVYAFIKPPQNTNEKDEKAEVSGYYNSSKLIV